MTETTRESAEQAGRGVRLPRTERRAQLLASAQDVFVANGYHAAAMDEIADRAGVSKPVLYQHFPGKLELYLALLQQKVEDMVSRVNTAIESTTDNKLRVHAAVAAYFDFVNAEDGSFRLVFESDLRGEAAVEQTIDHAMSRCVELIAEAVTADAGLDPERASLVAMGLVGLSQVTARYWLTRNRLVPQEEAIELIASLAWRGISGFPLQHP
ncbi:TetR/AcrR family transcriptional regulator [Actinoalloteichus sp. AHMU CJ021]|uniref:Transcriptional regulator, TetR family n=1 Tax=Actinoalloteichus caeruleus DSM 43889 TaxID=1120930 RepID=A0ABT1JKI5_ACTCY|nr:TetR/AcrR family transcriptional regulator [Actinoalloteichus caeruleus]AUS78207.1 TetR/AcrR family transcriptional regulator [Actinoalloteichus sp. AHMU CJ021]MCP2332246.1 transcriptional regulator, TetR family [Actinoalloteichus caeruleus DSM 43889]